MNEVELVSLSIKDFFTKKMMKFAFLPLLFTMIVLYALFFTAADFGFSALQIFIEQTENGQEVIISTDAPFYFLWATGLITFLFQYSITAWLVGFLFYTVGIIFVMMFSVFLTLVVIGFLTPYILNVLHKRHYSNIEMHGHGSLISPLFVLIKSSIVMLLLFFIFIPLYFIPFINIVAINLPFYYFFHKLLNYDVSSTLLSKEEYRFIHAKEANRFRIRTFLLYMLSMVPFITLFAAVFFVIYLGHGYFQELKKLHNMESEGKVSAIDKLLKIK